jgi:NADH-quinone oxidoreductase subunit M
MNSFPWLTVIGVIPLVGSAVVAGQPAGLTHRAKHVAQGFTLVTLV